MEQLRPNRTRQAADRGHDSSAVAESRDPRAAANLVALRVVGAVLVVATGAIHLYLYRDGFSSVPTIGGLFLTNFVVAVVLGLAILLRGRAFWSLLGAGFCLGTLVAFIVSVHWGLFGYQETLTGAWQERAVVVEVAGAVVCAGLTVTLLRGHRGLSAI
jgi:hypothetical protein